jgi:hypothetical protein
LAFLRAKGFRVVVPRATNSAVVRPGAVDESGGVLTLQVSHDDVAPRDQCANDAKARALLGVYFDAGSSPRSRGSIADTGHGQMVIAQGIAGAIHILRTGLTGVDEEDVGGSSLPRNGRSVV